MLIAPTPLMIVFVLVKELPIAVAGVFGTKEAAENEVVATVAFEASKVHAEMPLFGEFRGMNNKFLRLVMVIEVRPIGRAIGKVTGAPLYCAFEISYREDVRLSMN